MSDSISYIPGFTSAPNDQTIRQSDNVHSLTSGINSIGDMTSTVAGTPQDGISPITDLQQQQQQQQQQHLQVVNQQPLMTAPEHQNTNSPFGSEASIMTTYAMEGVILSDLPTHNSTSFASVPGVQPQEQQQQFQQFQHAVEMHHAMQQQQQQQQQHHQQQQQQLQQILEQPQMVMQTTEGISPQSLQHNLAQQQHHQQQQQILVSLPMSPPQARQQAVLVNPVVSLDSQSIPQMTSISFQQA
ncbi:hypothetical protein BGX20_006295, partial [Mortierella sp. AD010]